MKAVMASSVAVVACLGGLAVANYWIVQNPPASAPIVVSTRYEESAAWPSDTNVPGIPLPQLIHSLTRPLFLQSRRPWVAPPQPVQPPIATMQVPVEQPAPAEEIAPLQVTLAGVQQDPNGIRALILTAGQSEPRWVRSGEIVDGWTVSAIYATSVEFVAGGESRTFELYAQVLANPPQ